MKYSIAMKKLLERNQQSVPENYSRARSLINEQARMVTAVSSLEKVAMTRRPSETQEAHKLRISKYAKELKTQAELARGRINELARVNLQQISQSLINNTGYRETQYSREIRDRIFTMPVHERVEFLNKALQANHAETLAAVTEAPAFLSGLTEELQDRYRESYFARVEPDLIAERDLITTMMSESIRIVEQAELASSSEFNPLELQQINEREAEADAADAEFKQALNG